MPSNEPVPQYKLKANVRVIAVSMKQALERANVKLDQARNNYQTVIDTYKPKEGGK